MNVVCVTGTSDSGKTGLVVALVPALARRGLRVGYLKHAHEGFELDRPGSDTDRATRAGAAAVAVLGGGRGSALLQPGEETATAVLARMTGCDLVLAEGFGTSAWPKVLVVREGGERREVRPPVVAEVTTGADGRCAPEEVERVADVVAGTVQGTDVALVVDGRTVPVEGFPAQVVASTVLGLLSSLKGVGEPHEVLLRVRRRR
ncbi:MAG: molybdopterin-guanine dinucleotide biosynthesis protein B [Acidimicrobiia bacterium]|nr:molybdopterin-guanine dinucleotide biosynthesis protein B [Acidimicrobiia bacterium]